MRLIYGGALCNCAICAQVKMQQAQRKGLLGRAELAAVLAQLAEVLYHTQAP